MYEISPSRCAFPADESVPAEFCAMRRHEAAVCSAGVGERLDIYGISVMRSFQHAKEEMHFKKTKNTKNIKTPIISPLIF